MLILGIDLAEKMSAATLLSPEGTVRGEWACQETHPRARATFFQKFRAAAGDEETYVFCEDVFVAAARSGSYKGAVKFQGALELLMFMYWRETSHFKWITPNMWQQNLGFKPRTKKALDTARRLGQPAPPTSKMWAKTYCESLSYYPPDWARGSKALEDLRDSTLIAVYGVRIVTGDLLTTLSRPAG